MTKILAVTGSPRKGANTDAMAAAAIEAAQAMGAEVELFCLRDKEVRPCLGCNACKGDDYHCVQKDDMSALLDSIRDCDAILICSPVYFNQVSSPIKAWLDRTYALFNPAKGSLMGEKDNKKLGTIFTFGMGDPAVAESLGGYVADCTAHLGVKETRSLQFGRCFKPSTCASKEERVAEARALGEWLAQ